MLFFLIAWTGLLLVCLIVGAAILGATNVRAFDRVSDRSILAVWLGLLILAISLLAVSLVFPLTPIIGFLVAGILLAIASRQPQTTQVIKQLLHSLTPATMLGVGLFATGSAFLAAQPVIYFDVGLYHFQMIEWLSRFGLVPGLGLLHARFGFTTSWFGWVAPFNAGILDTRISALPGGFVFLLILLHLAICCLRVVQGRSRFIDWFIIIASLTYIPFCISYGLLGISSSPDTPVATLTILIVWSIFSILQHERKEKQEIPPNVALPEGVPLWGDRFLPVILAAGAVTIKLSALPLLLAAGFFYLSVSWSIQRFLVFASIAGGLILPMLAASVLTTGCPLYPSPALCLDLPWSVGAESAESMTTVIRDWNRWSGFPPENPTFAAWFTRWTNMERNAVFLIGCSLASALLLFISPNRSLATERNYALAIAFSGIALMMNSAPSLRFGMGYLCILPAVWLAQQFTLKSPLAGLSVFLIGGAASLLQQPLNDLAIFGVPALLLTIAIAFLTSKVKAQWLHTALVSILVIIAVLATWQGLNERKILPLIQAPDLLLPPTMQTLEGGRKSLKQVNDVKFYVPAESERSQCWAAEIPCTPYLTLPDIYLRDAKQGLRGGFVKAQP